MSDGRGPSGAPTTTGAPTPEAAEVRRQIVGILTPLTLSRGKFGHDWSSLIEVVSRTTGAPCALVALTLEGLASDGLVVKVQSSGGFDYARLAEVEQQSLF